MRRHSVKLALVGSAAAVVLAAGSTAAMALAGGMLHPPGMPWTGAAATTARPSCTPPSLPGRVVDVTLTDMGGRMRAWMHRGPGGGMMDGSTPGRMMDGSTPGRMMDGWTPGGMMDGRWRTAMMQIRADRTTVPAGKVSLRVANTGVMDHELVVLPLTAGARVGQRTVQPDGTVDERGSRGEVSDSCGAGGDEGLRAGEIGWTTLSLRPGRYELVCNLPGHYLAGMFAELDVTPAR